MRKSNFLNLVQGKKLYNYVTRGAIFGGGDKILWLKIYMVTRMRVYENVRIIENMYSKIPKIQRDGSGNDENRRKKPHS